MEPGRLTANGCSDSVLYADFGGAIDSESLLEFIDDGHDVLLAVDAQVSEELRGLVADLGVDLEPKGTAAIDHLDFVQSSSSVDHTVIASSEYGAVDGLFGTKPPEVDLHAILPESSMA